MWNKNKNVLRIKVLNSCDDFVWNKDSKNKILKNKIVGLEKLWYYLYVSAYLFC